MKAEITAEGDLILVAENSTEVYAITKFLKEADPKVTGEFYKYKKANDEK